MKSSSEVVALFYDTGLFLPLARKLGTQFSKVYYFTHWMKGFPIVNDVVIGDGFPEIERIDDIWDVVDQIDLAVFPDIQNAGLQLHLESMGIPVWGSRNGDKLETHRHYFHETLAKVGLPVAKYETVIGLSRLADYLVYKKNKYIKISKYRGSLETYHWRSWKQDGNTLYYLAVRYGLVKDLIPFMVFDAIETDLEIGGDTYCVDGQWPSIMIHGDEYKDKAYIGAVTDREDMPDQIKEVLDAFAPILKDYRYRNQWSMELRVVDDRAYFIDPTCRGGLPSSASQMELWGNIGDIIWHGANGELLDPVPTAKFAAECVLKAKSEKHSWKVVEIPKALEPFCKISSACMVDGVYGIPPDESHDEEIGWMVATGDTIAETIETMKKQSEQLPDGVHASVHPLTDLLKEVHSAEEQGIEFTDQTVPEPEIVVK